MAIDRACYCFIWLVLTCGTVAIFTAAGTSYWLEKGTAHHEGIFQRCINGDCSLIKFWQATEFEAARLLLIGSMGFLVLATLLSLVSPCTEKDVSFAYTLLDVVAFATGLAAMIVYTVYHKDEEGYKWAWSWILGWVGCGLHAGGLIMLFWAGCMDSDK